VARILLIDPDEALLSGLHASPLLGHHDIDIAAGDVDALRRLWQGEFDVVVTSPSTHVEEDLALLQEARRIRPRLRSVVLTARAGPESVVAALRARVFALFSQPFAADEIAEMIDRAAEDAPCHDGIELRSAHPDWLSVRVDCSVVTAERILRFISELQSEVPAADREGMLLAYRDVLMNAIGRAAEWAPGSAVDVIAVRSERALVFYVQFPGAGFDVVGASSQTDARDRQVPDDETGDSAHGFELLLARLVVDEVMLNEKGNEVVLIKHIR